MTQYNSLNVTLSNLQLNKLKSTIKNETDAALRLSSKVIQIKVIQMMTLIVLINYC